MNDSPEKNVLRTLTLCTVKALAKIEKLLLEAPDKKRDKKIQRITKELEVSNDEAMRNGLQMTAQYIAGVKTGRASKSGPIDPQRGADHKALMQFHHDHLQGGIPDGAAQAGALKWLLNNYSPEQLKKEYELQLKQEWRHKVNWITVKLDIGSSIFRNRNLHVVSKSDRSIENAKQVAAEFRNGSR